MTNKEISKAVLGVQHSSIPQAIAIIRHVYAQGYSEGHAACCDELGLKDGDETVTFTIDELVHRIKTMEPIDEKTVIKMLGLTEEE